MDADDIISAPYATALFLRREGKPSCFPLLSDDAMRDFREFHGQATGLCGDRRFRRCSGICCRCGRSGYWQTRTAFFQLALEDLGLAADKVAIIGDDIESDVGDGQACGLTGIMVKTGKYRGTYAQTAKIQPDFVLDSVKDLPHLLTQARR